MSPPLKEKRGCNTALKTAEVSATYHLSLALQIFSGARAASRRCVACNAHVTNRNLGGNDGRSALTGPVWCLRCADYPQQLLLALGGTA